MLLLLGSIRFSAYIDVDDACNESKINKKFHAFSLFTFAVSQFTIMVRAAWRMQNMYIVQQAQESRCSIEKQIIFQLARNQERHTCERIIIVVSSEICNFRLHFLVSLSPSIRSNAHCWKSKFSHRTYLLAGSSSTH